MSKEQLVTMARNIMDRQDQADEMKRATDEAMEALDAAIREAGYDPEEIVDLAY
jgi:type VI protein secretion system component VasF